jgi:prepilin-type N-terminal cleavage/methylation domain-containing protein
MKKMNFKKGFTLIELLVVVAIIGILASVVLASLNSARNKGKDAAIFAQLANMRGQAELYYATNNNYGTGYTTLTTATNAAGLDITPTTTCSAQTVVSAVTGGMFFAASTSAGLDGLIKGACSSGGTAITASVDAATATKWALKATGVSTNVWYCVDSTGASKSYTAGAPALASSACP